MAKFTVMTWNVQNLFLPTAEDGGPDTQTAFDQKLASLAAVIDAIKPHVLGLQEVGPNGALAALQAELTHPMPHSVEGEPDSRGIRVAFLSRRVLQDVRHIRPFPAGLLPIQSGDDPQGPEGPPMMNQMGRGGLDITVRGGNRDIHVLTTHMKSKLLTFPGGFQPADENERARYGSYALFRRSTEATTLRALLNDLLDGDGRNKAVILTGDMNDEVEAATTQILNGPKGSEIGTIGFDRQDQGDGDRMW
ncbi:MAG: endonuclease/exonuclease/phosphatase family protein, partial [Acidobacteria bacterium]|nr:endonuclease/exonuclease/phosphatase family protein [Acidobacteriota bacterium]